MGTIGGGITVSGGEVCVTVGGGMGDGLCKLPFDISHIMAAIIMRI